MTAYVQLLKKEIRQAMPMMLLFSIGIVVWMAFLFTRVGTWPPVLPFILGMMTAGFVPFWALWRSFYSLRQEWNGDHMYLLLAFPIPGWHITSAKMLTTIIEMFIYVVFIVIGTLVLFVAGEGGLLPWELMQDAALYRTAFFVTLLLITVLFIVMLIIQFSYLFSRLISRLRGLFAVVVGAVSSWFVLRLGGFLAPLFRWIPEVTLHNINLGSDTEAQVLETTIRLGIAPLVAAFVVAIGMFVFGSIILERDVEL